MCKLVSTSPRTSLNLTPNSVEQICGTLKTENCLLVARILESTDNLPEVMKWSRKQQSKWSEELYSPKKKVSNTKSRQEDRKKKYLFIAYVKYFSLLRQHLDSFTFMTGNKCQCSWSLLSVTMHYQALRNLPLRNRRLKVYSWYRNRRPPETYLGYIFSEMLDILSTDIITNEILISWQTEHSASRLISVGEAEPTAN